MALLYFPAALSNATWINNCKINKKKISKWYLSFRVKIIYVLPNNSSVQKKLQLVVEVGRKHQTQTAEVDFDNSQIRVDEWKEEVRITVWQCH